MPNFPRLNLRSKNELYKRLTGKKLKKDGAFEETKELFKYCSLNFEYLWKDNLTASKPEKEKWVRNCKSTKLGKLIKKIDSALLKQYDDVLPSYIHGGITGEYFKKSGLKVSKSTQSAALSLIDGKKGRWLLRLDLKSFFEQVTQKQIVNLFEKDFKCSPRIAWSIANLCCLKKGQKGSLKINSEKVLARGFSTSGRLAVWCNFRFFKELNCLVKNELKGHYPLMTIFVDDIGISAVKTSELKLKELAQKIVELAKKHNLIVHSVDSEKTDIIPPHKVKEHLGLRLTRHKIFPSLKTTRKRVQSIKQLKACKCPQKRRILKRSVKGLINNKHYTQKVSNG